MKRTSQEQTGIVGMLTRLYGEIYAIEDEFQLLVGDGDFRPRIDYFHDAVRAFAAEEDGDAPIKRLSVELLAYDVGCLRYIQAMPLAPFKAQANSAQMQLVRMEPGLVVAPSRLNRKARERITDLYQHYGVLFAALFKPFADHDYHARVDALNQDVQDINLIVQSLQALHDGKGSVERVSAAIEQLDEDKLRVALAGFLGEQKYKKRDEIKKLTQALGTHIVSKDRQVALIDKAHMNYSMSQLGIYEGSKELLQKMAGQGMNLVGKFVENSVAQTRRDMGR